MTGKLACVTRWRAARLILLSVPAAPHVDAAISSAAGRGLSCSIFNREEAIMSLADLVLAVGSGGLLVAWTIATLVLCLLGWLAFSLRQRQYRDDTSEK
jgi:hypothetical protein